MSLLDFLIFSALYNRNKNPELTEPPDDYYWGLDDEFDESGYEYPEDEDENDNEEDEHEDFY